MLDMDFVHLATFLRRIESKALELGDRMQKGYKRIWSSGGLGLYLLWLFMHLIVSIWYFAVDLVNSLESYLISSGFMKQYKDLDISKVKYLAVVLDSEEALDTMKVLELLRWLTAMGLRNVCLYDPEGVLKRSKDALSLWLRSEVVPNGANKDGLVKQKYLNLEVISFTDGKHAVARAANFLLKKHYLNADAEIPELTESDMADALAEIGYAAPEPDLMLIYGPVRCHLGFPAWRLRYTEIVHMGPLKSMKFGALIKAIRRYTMVRQNYGMYNCFNRQSAR
ncbi:ditrans,polycis-polyprenyl diphosphate synthase [Salvia divinorum]|uniref:ditrans,polycis-polyprenyl diphosphate synthase [(2E,6E)-farnesyldiphosphate specific] n=1 Tax=Salvia divinorum TaxID=28513 RepID=A0ABD1HD06_SALDI